MPQGPGCSNRQCGPLPISDRTAQENNGFSLPATAILPEAMTGADPEDLAQLVEEGWG
jgi:hypothetical protein